MHFKRLTDHPLKHLRSFSSRQRKLTQVSSCFRAIKEPCLSRYRHEKKWRQRNDFVIVDKNNSASSQAPNYKFSQNIKVQTNQYNVKAAALGFVVSGQSVIY